jgi:hypothetical protein
MNLQEKRVQQALSSLDSHLFLDKAMHPNGFLYYSIKCLVPEGEPYEVVSWTTPFEPLPLSMDIISQLYAQEGSVAEAVKQATVNNAAKRELARQKLDEQWEDMVKEQQARAKILARVDLGDRLGSRARRKA